MSKSAFFIALQKNCRHLACVHPDGRVEGLQTERSREEEGNEEPLVRCLEEHGYRHEGVCLGLPSEYFLTAEIDGSGLPRKQRRAAMLYRLEEQIPLDVEDLTANFVPSVGGKFLGLALETARVRTVIDNLTRAGIEVVAVCPTALLVLWGLGKDDASVDYTMVFAEEGVDVFRTVEGRLTGWSNSTADADEIVSALRADLLLHPAHADEVTARCIGPMPEGLAASLESKAAVRVKETHDDSPCDVAAEAARRVLSGAGPDWINFRRDGLAVPDAWRRVAGLLTSATVLSLACLVTLGAVFHLRGMQYEAVTEECETEQQAVYRAVYPHGTPPPGVKSRLRSELARLSGISGTDSELPARPSALNSLRLAVAGLPANVRLRIVEMRLDPTGVFIEGQVRNHSDAEIIARTLKKKGLHMSPPRTAKLKGGGVSFTLVGKIRNRTAGPTSKEP